MRIKGAIFSIFLVGFGSSRVFAHPNLKEPPSSSIRGNQISSSKTAC